MQQVPITFKELSIDKMPGFPRGMKPYNNLSPRINIVVGPNASGKSSTARMIQQLIWRRNGKGSQAEAYVDVGGETWKIRMDSESFLTQRNGQEDTLTGLPAQQAQSRYMLALHQLVGIDERELAQHIIRESIGGFNLDAAAEHLGYSRQFKTKNIKPHQDFKQKADHLKKVRKQQAELKEEEDQLQELYQQRDSAREAVRQKEFYDQVVDYLRARQELEQRYKEFREFPGIMEKIKGTEYDQIQELEGFIREDQDNIGLARQAIEQAQQELSTIQLPGEGISDRHLKELEARIGELDQMERNLRETQRMIDKEQAQVEEMLKALGDSLEPEKWEGIDLQGVQGLENFLLRAHQTISQLQFLQARIMELQKETDENANLEGDTLRQGIVSLSLWLQQQRSLKGTSARWVLILSMAGAGLAVVTYFAGWPGLVGIVILPLLAFFALQQKPTGPLTMRQEDFLRTGLQPPAQWDVDHVSQRLEQLTQFLEQVKHQEKIRQTIEDRKGEMDELEKQLQEIRHTYDQWKDRLQALPHLPGEDARNYSGLYDFVKNLNRWQQEHARLKGAEADYQTQREQYEHLFDKVAQLVRPYHNDPLQDAENARAVWEHLKDQEAHRRKQREEIERQEQSIQDLEGRLAQSQEKLRQIYRKLELEETTEGKERVRQLVEKLEVYQQTSESYRYARRKADEKKERMAEHSLYEAHRQQVEGMSLDQALEWARYYQEEADKRDAIIEKISGIQERIDRARRGNDLENALQQRQEALDELAGLYEQNVSSLTGQLLVDQLKQETRQHSRPAVFNRARELFNRITSGRYELDVAGKEEPAFRAVDTLLREGQPLEELSTGTQIQLLLSVRLAYIESQESALRLPILADELLANSDDNRARAIIGALMEISRQGRQVFYFTAQRDEVAKWKAYCQEKGQKDYTIMELSPDPVKPVTSPTHTPDLPTIRLRREDLPGPQNKSRREYGRQLQVPAFDLLKDTPEQLHLWYVLDDPLVLYRCLVRDLRYWGQLESFLSHNGYVEGLTSRDLPLLQDLIKVLRRLQELYRQGRPRPVDRQVLVASGAVSRKFIEPVDRLLRQVRGNPRRLLDHLRAGEVQGFRKNKMDKLEEYLLDEGYLDEQPRLDPEEIRVRLTALISHIRLEDRRAQQLIDEIVGSREGSAT